MYSTQLAGGPRRKLAEDDVGTVSISMLLGRGLCPDALAVDWGVDGRPLVAAARLANASHEEFAVGSGFHVP